MVTTLRLESKRVGHHNSNPFSIRNTFPDDNSDSFDRIERDNDSISVDDVIDSRHFIPKMSDGATCNQYIAHKSQDPKLSFTVVQESQCHSLAVGLLPCNHGTLSKLASVAGRWRCLKIGL